MEAQILVIYERNKWIKFTLSAIVRFRIENLTDNPFDWWIYYPLNNPGSCYWITWWIVLMKITTTVVIFIKTVDQVNRELLLHQLLILHLKKWLWVKWYNWIDLHRKNYSLWLEINGHFCVTDSWKEKSRKLQGRRYVHLRCFRGIQSQRFQLGHNSTSSSSRRGMQSASMHPRKRLASRSRHRWKHPGKHRQQS